MLPGGTLSNFFQANDGSTVNILGGTTFTTIGNNGSEINMTLGRAINLIANPGAVLNISGGLVTGQVEAESVVNVSGGRTSFVVDFAPTADINITGGAIERLQARQSTVSLSGLDFKINGVAVAELSAEGDSSTITLPADSVLTGVLADGRAFAHYQSPLETDPFVVKFVRSATPTPPAPSTVHVTDDSNVEWIGNQQSMVVNAGGTLLEHFRAGPGSRIEVNGGRIHEAFHAVSAEIELESGSIGRRSKYFDNTVVNMQGGLLEDDARFFKGSTLNVFGGQVAGASIRAGATANIHGGGHYRVGADELGTVNVHGGEINQLGADDGGTLNVYGGRIVGSLEASGASVNIYGGSFSDVFNPRLGSQLTLHATELRRNGMLISGLQNVGDTQTIDTAAGDILSGVFADGTPFVLGGEEYDLPQNVHLVQSTDYAPGPSLINVPNDPAPQGVHNGQTLILHDGGELPINFTVSHGSTVEIRGGTVGYNFEAIGAQVDISGGRVSTLDAFSGATINIGGDAEWSGLEVFQDATANISGGLGNGLDWYRARKGSTLNITGGEMRGALEAEGATVNISGGLHRGMVLFHDGNATISSGEFSQGISVMSGSKLLATGGTLAGISTSLGDSDLSGIAHTKAIVDGVKVFRLRAADESVIEVRSGVVGDSDAVGGELIFRGGALGDSHEWITGNVELHGYDFQLNGVPIAGLDTEGQSLNWNGGANLTGTLSDGTPFNLFANDNFQTLTINGGVLKLVRSAIPNLPATVDIPNSPAPYGASAGRTVVVNAGGALDDNFLAGHDSVVEIHDGTVGNNFEADRSQVTIDGGIIGKDLDVFDGAVVTVANGLIGEQVEIHAGGVLNLQGGQIKRLGKAVGGTLNMLGGSLGSGFQALDGSVVNVSGGFVESEFTVGNAATANVTGGDFQSQLRAEAGSEANISGGSLGVDARNGSMVSISGGVIDQGSIARSGSQVVVTGGTFGDAMVNAAGQDFVMHGVNFEVDGVAVPGLSNPDDETTVTVGNGQLFTGTLADGTPFAFSTAENDGLNTLRLVRSASPAAGPTLIQVPNDIAPLGVHAGQQLELLDGGSLLESFNAGRDSMVTIRGGTVGRNFEAVAAVVNVEGGHVGEDFDAFTGSEINISGGTVGGNFDAYASSEVNILGGTVSRVDALNGSSINLKGGSLGELRATAGSHSIWTGGTMGGANISGTGATLEIHGVDFRFLDGLGFLLENEGDTLQLNLSAGTILLGTLADGTPLVLSTLFNNTQIANGALTLVQSARPGMLGPVFQHVVDSNAPSAIGAGQTLLVDSGGQLPNNFVAGPGSQLIVHGGLVGSGLKASGAELVITDGTVGPNFTALGDAEITIMGGEFGAGFSLYSGAHAIVRGGLLPSSFRIEAGASVDIHGRSFLLNGQSIAGLNEFGDSLLLGARGGQLLTAILADGSLLEWRLSSPLTPRTPFGFSNQAVLRLHLIPEPTAIMLFGQVLVLTLLWTRRRGNNIE